MASIESLLNPLPDFGRFTLPATSSTYTTRAVASLPGSSRPKKQKMAKDAPIFKEGRIRGELRYPPCEDRDAKLTVAHKEFQIHPMGNIAQYPRHIPYNSDKKTFQEKTGRESFEVFQYTFKIPGEDKTWTVMWDYNIGLVRTTHLFKCIGYSKTTPAKMLNLNPGLREICHSITGGALAAQGYWMPFDAAKAVVATFCWKIRHALTPLFGVDFPSLCIPPEDSERYGLMIIDPAIVKRAADVAELYRMAELRPGSIPLSLPQTPAIHHTPSLPPASVKLDMVSGSGRQILLPKTPSSSVRRVRRANLSSSDSSSSGCGSSPEYSDSYCTSPESPYKNSFTPVNTPRSSDNRSSYGIGLNSNIPSPAEVLARVSLIPGKTGNGDDNGDDCDGESDEDGSYTTDTTLSSNPVNTNMDINVHIGGKNTDTDSSKDVLSMDLDKIDSDNDSDTCSRDTPSPSQRRRTGSRSEKNSNRDSESKLFAREVKAAHALLSLHTQNATTPTTPAASTAVQGKDMHHEHGCSLSVLPPSHHYDSLECEGGRKELKRRRASA
ncbi:hypothetical protein MPDQ_003406 [Monascus purpureus]|uniref:HTH APSES-type domain-containing protein n=1 Tax=Monascus purpureus TaxID=5098 RepID=A0A507QL06_MONPU|nr:hypothetical protein MPDQ_003406 [Monascus purpureus]BDD63741.1 hypothetical protein MAP00_008604 [Monascus purpureus]